MSQQDVLRVLKRQPKKEFALEELAKKLKVEVNKLNVWVNKLDKWGLIACRKEDGKKYVKLATRK
ncbi:MAG: hypothetical protein J7J38_00540 [Candidatus Aenigmarchaeota archaeon]|nr:hypothetical protein [Candidatus Aenigmarchaeota archaeon]